MAERSCTPAPSRRALFGAAAALPALAAMPTSAGAAERRTSRLAALLAEHDAAVVTYCTAPRDSDEDAQWAEVGRLRTAILTGTIESHGDAAAKLKMAAVSFDQGALTDGTDEAAVRAVAAWLEAL